MPDRLNLAPRHRRVLKTLLREHLPNTEVWAYGSRVNGRGHDGSDLDLVLRGPGLKKIALERLMDFEEAVRESTIPILVEARDWARLPERFQREIEREYVVVVGVGAPKMTGSGNRSTLTGSSLLGSHSRWRRVPLGDFVTLQRGHDLPATVRRPGNTPILGSFGITGWHDESRAAGPGVTVGRSGASFGVVSYSPVDYWPLNTALYVTDFHGNDQRFAYYFLRHFDFRSFNSGSAQPSLNRNFIHPIPVVVPLLPEQRAIAHILGTLDDKIELNRRMTEMLEAMARALFKSWFVDFDPVRAKMEGRDTGLPQDIADLFPDRLVDSEMGEIPEGWTVASLAERIDVNPRRSLRKGQAAPYLPMAKMPTRGHMPDSVAVRPFGSGMRFTNGDTLVARITPCLENGKTAYVDFLTDGEIGWGSTEYIVLRPQPPLPNQFAYCLARSARFREFAIRNMSGTSGRQRVPPTALRGFLLVVPPGRVAARFGKIVASLFERASNAAHGSRTLAALRDSLLPKLISGEIRLSETAWTLGMTDR